MIPLVLLAGVLGAGKTTYLRRLLPALGARAVRPRVILNDYENAQVDAATLQDLTPTLVPISGSCLCCETQEQLIEALGAMPLGPGDVIVVETNGTTDTASLLELITGAKALDRIAPPLQITVVDAQRFGTRGWQNVLEAEQIQTATHLSVSRADLVPAARLAEVDAAAAALAPRAVPGTTPEALADALAALATRLAGIPGREALDPALLEPPPPRRRSADAHRAAHAFASFQVPLPEPIPEAAFLRFLEELPETVLRAKGIVALADQGGEKRVFQKVGAAAEISPCRLADPDELEPVAIFFGVGASPLAVRERLRRLFAG